MIIAKIFVYRDAEGLSLKNKLKPYGLLVLVAGVIIALDQITKAIVINNIQMGGTWMPLEWLAPYARIVHWYNTGVAFGMFQNGNTIFSVLAIIVSIAIIWYFPQVPKEDWPLRLAMCLQLGGAMGNLIDRLVIGHVTDFISVGDFPVFNVADSAITIGVAVLVIGVWLQERREKQNPPINPESPVNDDHSPAAYQQSHE